MPRQGSSVPTADPRVSGSPRAPAATDSAPVAPPVAPPAIPGMRKAAGRRQCHPWRQDCLSLRCRRCSGRPVVAAVDPAAAAGGIRRRSSASARPIGAGVPAGQIPIVNRCQVTASSGQPRRGPPTSIAQSGMHAQAAELAARCAESSFRHHSMAQCRLPLRAAGEGGSSHGNASQPAPHWASSITSGIGSASCSSED